MDRKLAASLAAAAQRVLTMPAGSRKLAGAPAGWSPVVGYGTEIGAGGQVVDTSWWQVPGQPQAVLKWLFAHVPSGWTAAGQGTYGAAPTDVTVPKQHPSAGQYWAWQDGFSPFHVPAVIGVYDLYVTEAENSAGQVYAQVDSVASWITPRPADEVVPASAKVVTITAVPETGTALPKGSPTTVTDPAKVAKIASLLNGLYVDGGAALCAPPAPTNEIRLEFSATVGGPVLATATVDLLGCGEVQFSVPGASTLALAESSNKLGPDILSLAHLNWFS